MASAGFHWSVQASQEREAEKARNKPYRGGFFSAVLGPAEGEKVAVNSFVGKTTIAFAYPFASTNAWIRGMPETGTTMLSIIGSDSNDIQPVTYYDKTKTTSVQAYQVAATQIRQSPTTIAANILPYRDLHPGDLDLGSNFAQQFLGLRDVYQARGGLSHLTMTSLKAEIDTPQFEVHGPAHKTQQALNDEMRFGAVRRSQLLTSNPTLPGLVRGTSFDVSALTAPFAKEWSVILDWKGIPGNLLDHRQGIVTEDDGTLATGQRTNRQLRGRWRWKSLLFSETKAEIDDGGNLYFSTALDATEGGAIDIPTGSFDMKVGQRMTMRSNLDAEVSSQFGRISITALTGFSVSTPTFGEIKATLGLKASSTGVINIDTPIPSGVQIGGGLGPKYPALIANPAYLSTQEAYLSTHAAFIGSALAYGSSASAAWAAVGPLTAALDPTGSVATLCATAGAAGAALATAATALQTALGAFMPTLSPAPVGYISGKLISE